MRCEEKPLRHRGTEKAEGNQFKYFEAIAHWEFEIGNRSAPYRPHGTTTKNLPFPPILCVAKVLPEGTWGSRFHTKCDKKSVPLYVPSSRAWRLQPGERAVPLLRFFQALA